MTQQPDRWAQLAQELWGMVLPMMTGTEQRRELAAALRSAHDAGRREALEEADKAVSAIWLDGKSNKTHRDNYHFGRGAYAALEALRALATPSAKEGT